MYGPKLECLNDSIISAAFPLMRGPIINVEESTNTDQSQLQHTCTLDLGFVSGAAGRLGTDTKCPRS